MPRHCRQTGDRSMRVARSPVLAVQTRLGTCLVPKRRTMLRAIAANCASLGFPQHARSRSTSCNSSAGLTGGMLARAVAVVAMRPRGKAKASPRRSQKL